MTPEESIAMDILMRAVVAPDERGISTLTIPGLEDLIRAYGADCAARERAEKHELQRHLGIQKSRRMTEQEAHAAIRQTAAAFVQKWHDGTVWGSDELRHFAHQFEQALRSLP